MGRSSRRLPEPCEYDLWDLAMGISDFDTRNLICELYGWPQTFADS